MAEAGEKKEDGRGKTRVRVGAGARAGHCQGRRRSWEGAGEARVWLDKEQGEKQCKSRTGAWGCRSRSMVGASQPQCRSI